MTDPGLMDNQTGLGDTYGAALRAFVSSGDEDDLSQAYSIARSALAEGVPLNWLYSVHRAATEDGQLQKDAAAAEVFLLEALSVYDMAFRGYRQTVTRLSHEVEERKRVEEDLRQATFELARQRDDLDKLVADRTGELLLRNDELKLLNAQLRQTNQEQAEFTYAISHDLLSPLNTISMMLGFLEEDLKESAAPQISESLGAARTTADRMHTIVEDIVKYSRMIGQEHSFGPVDLNKLVREICSDLQSDLDRHGARLKIEDLPPVRGEQIQLRMLFQNFISNALKFRGERAPEVTIRATPAPRAEWVGVTIRDNGIGIDPAHHDRIFGLFQRLHTYEEYPGTGLGLTLCKRIASNHGGDISVTSEVGKGTEFTITLVRHHDKD